LLNGLKLKLFGSALIPPKPLLARLATQPKKIVGKKTPKNRTPKANETYANDTHLPPILSLILLIFISLLSVHTFTLFTTFPAYKQRAADWFLNDREAWLTSGHVTGFYLIQLNWVCVYVCV